MISIDRVRDDTPGCESIIHLNNAGAALPPHQVTDAVVDYIQLEGRIGGYEAQDARLADLDRLYEATAQLLNCHPQEVAFTSSASDAWWRGFSSVALDTGDRLIIGRSEFQTNAFGILQARDRGVLVDVVPNDEDGEIDLNALDKLLDDDVKLICLTQISMSNGAIQPAAAVGQRARSIGATYLLDACQAAGQLPLDVEELGCDFLVYTGRKFMRGPRATGILYARESVMEHLGPSPFVDGRSAEWTGPESFEFLPGARRFEFGEQNFAGKVGLTVATEYALELGLPEIRARIDVLSGQFRSGLRATTGVTVHDEGRSQSGIVTFTVAGHSPAQVAGYLSKHGINVSAPGRRNAQLDLGARGLDAVVRAGVHYYNTESELLTCLDRLAALAT